MGRQYEDEERGERRIMEVENMGVKNGKKEEEYRYILRCEKGDKTRIRERQNERRRKGAKKRSGRGRQEPWEAVPLLPHNKDKEKEEDGRRLKG